MINQLTKEKNTEHTLREREDKEQQSAIVCAQIHQNSRWLRY